jgi:glycogen operon protein
MLLGGDEFGRTQHGNNNAWCQDSELSWFDWSMSGEQEDLLAFTRRVIRLRKTHPAFRRTRFLRGHDPEAIGLSDVWWFRPDGRKVTRRDWERAGGQVLGVFLNGDELREVTPDGAPVIDDSFLLLFNAGHEDVEFHLPNERFGARWSVVLTTGDKERRDEQYAALEACDVESRSLLVLRRGDPVAAE